MASGAEVVGAAAQGASLIPALIGRGQNKQLATGFVGQPGYDPNASFYGGGPTGRAEYVNRMEGQRQLVDGRSAFQANYGQADQDRALGMQARGGQQAMANAMQARALGQVPSIAQMQADRQMGQATAAQASMAASARGAGAMALAQQNAANNTANAHGAISGQAQVNAANERMQAEQAAFGAHSAMRGQDLGSQGQSASQAQFQAQMQQANRAQNDSRAMGYEQLGANANQAELQARTQNQGTLAGSQSAATTANQRTGDQNAQSKGLIETVGDFFSDANAKIMLSDMGGKVPALMPGGGGAMNPTATASFDKLGAAGDMDVLGSLKAHSDFATRFAGDAGSGPTTGMMSDTRTKRAALLAEGRRQGATAAQRGGPSLDAMLDDRARGAYGPPADDAMLDDRLAQHADRGIGKAALDNAIGAQVAQDKATPDSPAEQWRRSFGDPENAVSGARDRDNRAEAARIRARFEAPVSADAKAPPAWWQGIGAVGQSLSEAQFGRGQAPMLSDDRTKLAAAWDEGHAAAARDVAALSRMPPEELKKRSAGSTLAQAVRDSRAGAWDEGSKTSSRTAFERGASYATKQITGEDMRPWVRDDSGAEEELAPEPPKGRQMQSFQRENPIAEANRSMEGQPYAYKPGMTPPEQKPGEVNVGPMAQNMEQSPVAGTAVKTDPNTGLKMIDRDKALKVVMSGVADLQRQQDQTRASMQRLTLAGGGRKR